MSYVYKCGNCRSIVSTGQHYCGSCGRVLTWTQAGGGQVCPVHNCTCGMPHGQQQVIVLDGQQQVVGSDRQVVVQRTGDLQGYTLCDDGKCTIL